MYVLQAIQLSTHVLSLSTSAHICCATEHKKLELMMPLSIIVKLDQVTRSQRESHCPHNLLNQSLFVTVILMGHL